MMCDDSQQCTVCLSQVIRAQLHLRRLVFLDDEHPVEFRHLHGDNPCLLAGMITYRALQRVKHVCLYPRAVRRLPDGSADRLAAIEVGCVAHFMLLVVFTSINALGLTPACSISSICCAICKSAPSSPGLATICSAARRMRSPEAKGIEIAGNPATLNGAVLVINASRTVPDQSLNSGMEG